MRRETTELHTQVDTLTSAQREISLFVQKLGVKIFAAKGPVEIQAQTDAMSLFADRDVSMSSVNGTVRISAKTELMLECGGAFIQLKDGSITLGGPADLFFKVITIQKKGAASMQFSPKLPAPNDLADLTGHGSKFSG